MTTHSSILGKSHGQRSLMDYSSWGHKRVGNSLMTKEQQGMGLAKLEELHLKG